MMTGDIFINVRNFNTNLLPTLKRFHF